EDIFLHPELYQLTDKQLIYIARFHKLDAEVFNFLEREGVPPAGIKEFQRDWLHRVWIGKTTPEGKFLAVRGRPGMRGGAPGTKRAYEMRRTIPTMAQGI
ncbi:MAG: hypothetical protein COW28_03860, partial [bacterium (Candidatus Ratteibacteria) CG15_BIG_FIL_POST_REV_8_21_14_020_41_12]